MIGILALQGNYHAHTKILVGLKIPVKEIRYPNQLRDIDGLIIPGGESTTINDLMKRVGFHDEIKAFSLKKPILGTCAGLIMMSSRIKNDNQLSTLDILDIEVSRNAYGRQADSFIGNVKVDINQQAFSIKAPFIRAPKIISTGDSIDVIAKCNGDIVVVKSGIHYGLTFHPELSNIAFFHNYVFTKKNELMKENNAA